MSYLYLKKKKEKKKKSPTLNSNLRVLSRFQQDNLYKHLLPLFFVCSNLAKQIKHVISKAYLLKQLLLCKVIVSHDLKENPLRNYFKTNPSEYLHFLLSRVWCFMCIISLKVHCFIGQSKVKAQELVFKSKIRLKSRIRLEDLEFWLFGLFSRISDLNTNYCGKSKTRYRWCK